MLRTEMRKKEQTGGMPPILYRWLPARVCEQLKRVEGEWEELHLRVGRHASVTVGGENRVVHACLGQDDMDAILMSLCDGSLYAHRENISRGYLTLAQGIRVGLCGRAFVEGEGRDGRVLAVRDIDSLCIRFPHAIRLVGRELLPVIRQGFPRGVLIYSPPGVGKTTLLRALACDLSCGEGALRTAVVDNRCEINNGTFDSACQICFLSGYPAGQGVEIAVRSMNAQLVICDELGNPEEAHALLGVANCGVPVIATAHAANARQLLARPGLDVLHEAGVFAHYIGITRRPGVKDYDYLVEAWEDV